MNARKITDKKTFTASITKNPAIYIILLVFAVLFTGVYLLYRLSAAKPSLAPPKSITVNGTEYPYKQYLIGCVMNNLCYQDFTGGAPSPSDTAGINAVARAVHSSLMYLYQRQALEAGGLYSVKFLPPIEQEQYFGERLSEFKKYAEAAAEYAVKNPLTINGEYGFFPVCRISNGALIAVEGLSHTKSLYCNMDKAAVYYNGECQLTAEGIAERVLSRYTDMVLSPDRKSWITDIKADSTGNVLSVNLCGLTVSGFEAAEILGLKSVCFEIAYTENVYSFKTKGVGNSCGMSVYSALLLSRSGKTEEEITKTFYNAE